MAITFINPDTSLLAKNQYLKTEIFAGISSFLATMYIIVVNPSILSQAGLPFSGVLTATVLVCFFSSLMMGVYAKNPILVAPGMGLNAFFTYTAVQGMGIRWEVALGAVFWSGIVFILLSALNIRTYIVKAIPRQLRYAIAAGIGLFITLIGLINSNLIGPNSATVIGLNKLQPATITFLAGLMLTSVFVVKRIPGAIIIGIIFTTLAAIPIGRWWGETPLVVWQGIFSKPDFSLVLKLDFVQSLQFAVWPVVFAFVFTDMFDSLSTFVGIAEAAQLFDENGDPRNLKKSLLTDAFSTTLAGLLGSSPGTAYIESAIGIEQGGKTGLTAIVASFLFLPFMFLSPLLSIIPSIATAPALILVGVFMIKPVTKINWDRLDDAIPSFLAMILIPFTYSITQGIIYGFLSWTLIKMATGKYNELSLSLLIIDAFAIMAIILG